MTMHSENLQTKNDQLNKLAVTSIVLAVVAVLGLWFLGVASLAVFAVGAGHISLNQIKLQGGKGRTLATAALAIGYAIAALALFSSLAAIPSMIR